MITLPFLLLYSQPEKGYICKGGGWEREKNPMVLKTKERKKKCNEKIFIPVSREYHANTTVPQEILSTEGFSEWQSKGWVQCLLIHSCSVCTTKALWLRVVFFLKEFIPKLIIQMDYVTSFIITLDILLLNYLPIQTHIVLKLEKIKRTKLAASHSLASKHNSELL